MNNRSQFAIAYLNTLTFSSVQMLLYIIIPYLSETTGVPVASIIGAISVGSFIFAFMGPYWAARSDERGRKFVLGIGMVGMTLSFVLLSGLFYFHHELSLLAKTAMIFTSRILYGLLASAVVPVSQAWQIDMSPASERMKVLTRNSMCLNLGRILGPLLILYKGFSFELLIYGASLWVLLLALFCLLVADPGVIRERTTVRLKDAVKEQWFKWKQVLIKNPGPLWLAMVFTSFIGILHTFLGQHLKLTLNIRGDEATVLMAKIVLVLSLACVLIQQVGIWTFKKKWRPRLVIGTLGIVAGSLLLQTSTTVAGIWWAIAFLAFAIAYIPPVYLTLASSGGVKEDYGRKLGSTSIAHSLGYSVGAGLIALSLKFNLFNQISLVVGISIAIVFIMFNLLFKFKSGELAGAHG